MNNANHQKFVLVENISGWHLIYTKFGSVLGTDFSYLVSHVNCLMWSLHKVHKISAWLEAASVCASTCFFHTNLWLVVTSGIGGLDLSLSCEFRLGSYQFTIIHTYCEAWVESNNFSQMWLMVWKITVVHIDSLTIILLWNLNVSEILEWYEVDSLGTAVVKGSVVVSWMVGGWMNEWLIDWLIDWLIE
jgi:hypothetical protein